jgi:predicted PurR-regulated permease PerM
MSAAPPSGQDPDPRNRGRVETAIGLVVLVLLALGCLLVLTPFVSAILWAALLCFSSWGAYSRLRSLLGGRKSLAALVMTLIVAAVAVVPFVVVVENLADNVTAVITGLRHVIEQETEASPKWLAQFPLLGQHLHDYLTSLAHDPAARRTEIGNLIGPLREIAVRLGKALGRGILELVLGLLICFFLYRDGDTAAARLDNAVFRIAGARGRRLLDIASVTVTGVFYGIIGTSLIQGVLVGIGLWIAGVPGAFLLGFTAFLLAFIPMGPALIWLPAAFWLFEDSSTKWAIFMIVWGVVAVGGVDHVIKPILISRSGTTPLILVMLGVFGGALVFGLIGVFIGPTLLAVGYALIDEWSGRLAPDHPSGASA